MSEAVDTSTIWCINVTPSVTSKLINHMESDKIPTHHNDNNKMAQECLKCATVSRQGHPCIKQVGKLLDSMATSVPRWLAMATSKVKVQVHR